MKLETTGGAKALDDDEPPLASEMPIIVNENGAGMLAPLDYKSVIRDLEAVSFKGMSEGGLREV